MVGLYGVLTRRNLIKIILGLSVMQYSINLFLVLVGYVQGGQAPIVTQVGTPAVYVDPLPQAMVLTVIVIGLATTSLLLAIAIRLYKKHNTFDIKSMRLLKG
jgi:multisubunit Na+/H+ antiporter MnhC subunit